MMPIRDAPDIQASYRIVRVAGYPAKYLAMHWNMTIIIHKFLN
jgi:hypothetical protein